MTNGKPFSGWNLWKMLFNAPWTAIFSIIVVVSAMLFIASVISREGNEVDIRNVEFARGFITVLFGVGTIGIALLVTLSAIFLNDANAKERFDRAKEVLSLLLGIFGTIVGFYYGAERQKPPGAASGQENQKQNVTSSGPNQNAAPAPGIPSEVAKKADELAKSPPPRAVEPKK